MSDNIKLIIEMPKELYEALLNGYEEPYSRMLSDTVKNGIPLDDVKADIKQGYCTVNNDYDQGRNYGLYIATQILDNIGKESEE